MYYSLFHTVSIEKVCKVILNESTYKRAEAKLEKICMTSKYFHFKNICFA